MSSTARTNEKPLVVLKGEFIDLLVSACQGEEEPRTTTKYMYIYIENIQGRGRKFVKGDSHIRTYMRAVYTEIDAAHASGKFYSIYPMLLLWGQSVLACRRTRLFQNKNMNY